MLNKCRSNLGLVIAITFCLFLVFSIFYSTSSTGRDYQEMELIAVGSYAGTVVRVYLLQYEGKKYLLNDDGGILEVKP